MRGLDQLIRIERPDPSARNALNEPQTVWSLIARSWAQIEVLADAETAQGAETVGTLRARITVPDNAALRGLTSRDRIHGDDHLWNVVSVVPHEKGRGRMLVITAVRDSRG